MFRLGSGVWVGLERFPRVSGDVPIMDMLQKILDQFSPRERGCSAHDMEDFAVNHVFPA